MYFGQKVHFTQVSFTQSGVLKILIGLFVYEFSLEKAMELAVTGFNQVL